MMPLLPIWILAVPLVIALVERLRTPQQGYTHRTTRVADTTLSTPVPDSVVTARSGEDIVSYLKRQHEEIKALFAETLAAPVEKRAALFLSLRRLLATHEATEEELVHPEATHALGERGHVVVAERLKEERIAANAIATLEHLSVDSMQFEMDLRKLQNDVIAHATHEEQEEFPALLGMSSARLTRVQDVAQAIYVEDRSLTAGQDASWDSGPFLGMLQRARAILGGSVDVRGRQTASREVAHS